MDASSRYDFLYSDTIQLAAAVGATGQIAIKTQQDSIFVVQTLTAVFDAGFHARFSDDGNGNAWGNRLVSNYCLFGTVWRPNILIQPIMIFPTSKVVLDLTNDTAVLNDVEITLGGYKIFQPAFSRPSGAMKIDQWFQYSEEVSLTALQAESFSIQINSDSAFEVQKAMASYTSMPNTALGKFKAKMSDSGLGKAWSDREIDRDNQFGYADYPRILPFPKVVGANSQINIDITDLSGFANVVEIVLEGVKRYRA